MSSTTPPSSATKKPSSSASRPQQYREELLPRTWRATAHYFVLIASRAERGNSDELNEATRNFLFNRLEWEKLINYLEAKVEGKAEEMENLQHYVRTQPTLGKSSRKRKAVDQVEPKTIPKIE